MTQSISHITAEAMTAESTIDRSLRTIIERDFHRPELSLSTYSITQVKDNTCIVYNIHTQKKKKPSYFNWKTFTNVLVLRQSDVVARNFVTVTRIDVDLVEVMMCPQGYFIYVITRMRETTFKSEKKQHVHTLGWNFAISLFHSWEKFRHLIFLFLTGILIIISTVFNEGWITLVSNIMWLWMSSASVTRDGTTRLMVCQIVYVIFCIGNGTT